MILQSIIESKEMVDSYATEWRNFYKASYYTNIIFEYLNKLILQSREIEGMLHKPTSFVPLSMNLCVGALGCSVWEKEIISALREKGLVKALISMMKKDRLGMNVDDKVCLEVARSFIICRDYSDQPYALYESIFEMECLQDTRLFYHEEASKMLASCSISAYMKYVWQFLIGV